MIVVALVALLGSEPEDIADDIIGVITGFMVLSALLFGVVGALNLTSEYSHNTIRVTFAAAPQRVRVLLAKVVVTIAITAVIAAVTVTICYFVGTIILDNRDVKVIVDGEDKVAMMCTVVLSMLLAALGYGLGLIIRNSPATVALVILWPLLLENIANAVLDAAGIDNPTPWLPYQSAIVMLNPDHGSRDPSRLHGALYLGAVVVGLIIIGLFVNDRRDA